MIGKIFYKNDWHSALFENDTLKILSRTWPLPFYLKGRTKVEEFLNNERFLSAIMEDSNYYIFDLKVSLLNDDFNDNLILTCEYANYFMTSIRDFMEFKGLQNIRKIVFCDGVPRIMNDFFMTKIE